MSRLWYLAPLLLLLSACGGDNKMDAPTTWQDVALWAIAGFMLVGITWAERHRR